MSKYAVSLLLKSSECQYGQWETYYDHSVVIIEVEKEFHLFEKAHQFIETHKPQWDLESIKSTKID